LVDGFFVRRQRPFAGQGIEVGFREGFHGGVLCWLWRIGNVGGAGCNRWGVRLPRRNDWFMGLALEK
jgi:hypothetical protein